MWTDKGKLALGKFLGHLITGAVMFLAVLLLSAVLNVVGHWIITWVNDPFFGVMVLWTERVILVADVGFLVVWAGYSTYMAIKEMRDE